MSDRTDLISPSVERSMLQKSAGGVGYVLTEVVQIVFYASLMGHIALSFGNSLVTLGSLSDIKKRILDLCILENDSITITYHFIDDHIKYEITPESVAQVQRQSKDRTASLFYKECSYKLHNFPPTKMTQICVIFVYKYYSVRGGFEPPWGSRLCPSRS